MSTRQKYRLFWGDTHHNTYTGQKQEPALDEILAFAAKHLDFYSGAYYTPTAENVGIAKERLEITLAQFKKAGMQTNSVPADAWKGIVAERIKDESTIAREWEEFQAVISSENSPGQFITFPGYEWQGDGTWGDHNVIYKNEGYPVSMATTLPELYKYLRGRDALAIPHHIGYNTAIRAPRWEYCEEKITPFTEIYSVHGCSETDEEWIGLHYNPHMGPGVAGSTYQEALDRGLHLGAICSTDNWTNVPGCWGQGIMACLATELTRESLWEAFQQRRIYGVTGDRIELSFTCNGEPMGSILKKTSQRNLHITVRGQDAIDRVEVLRNGRVIATYCHQEKWDIPSGDAASLFKVRIEPGWGPQNGELPFFRHDWTGELFLSEGRFVNLSRCWTTRNNDVPTLDGSRAQFNMSTLQSYDKGNLPSAVVFEFKARPSSEMMLHLNGETIKDSVCSLAQGSRLIWYREECLNMIRDMTGIEPENFERHDPLFFHYAFKAKIHRIIPEAAYAVNFEFSDSDRIAGRTNYRVRVEQRNGQRAWSSPIWIESQ